jgi:hypothetical protein
MLIKCVSAQKFIPFPSCTSLVFGIALLSMCPHLSAQTVTLSGQLVTEDSLQPLSNATIVATSLTRPPRVLETLTGPDGRFSFGAIAGHPYLLCSRAAGNYADSCKFSKPIEVRAAANMPAIRMTAPVGIRMRVRVVDVDGLLRSPLGTVAAADPLLLHVFAEEEMTRTRIPLQLITSTSVPSAVEAAVVIPTSLNWKIAMSSIRGKLFDPSGNAYQSDTAISHPASYGGSEFLAVFSLRAK